MKASTGRYPNKYGVYERDLCEIVMIRMEKSHVEIIIAETPEGVRASYSFRTKSGGSGAMPSIRGELNPDRETAIRVNIEAAIRILKNHRAVANSESAAVECQKLIDALAERIIKEKQFNLF